MKSMSRLSSSCVTWLSESSAQARWRADDAVRTSSESGWRLPSTRNWTAEWATMWTSVARRRLPSARMSMMSGASPLPSQMRPARKVPERLLMDMAHRGWRCLSMRTGGGLRQTPSLGVVPAGGTRLPAAGRPSEVAGGARVRGIQYWIIVSFIHRTLGRRDDYPDLDTRCPGTTRDLGGQPARSTTPPTPARHSITAGERDMRPARPGASSPACGAANARPLWRP